MTAKQQVQSYIDATNTATGADDTTLRAAVLRLIDGYGAGEYYFAANGMYYSPIMETPENVSFGVTPGWFQNCAELVELTIGKLASDRLLNTFQSNPKLRIVAFPHQSTYSGGNTNTFRYCPNLEKIRLGSVGYPVTSIDFTVHSDVGAFELTIYCTDPEDITFGYTPIRADTTVIYRDSETGEVIEL